MIKSERSPLFLMANLGSEVSQIFSHIEKGDLPSAKSSRSRAERIVRMLLLHPGMKNRTGEVEILEEIMEDVFVPHRRFLITKVEIESYFLPFALRILSSAGAV